MPPVHHYSTGPLIWGGGATSTIIPVFEVFRGQILQMEECVDGQTLTSAWWTERLGGLKRAKGGVWRRG